MFGFDDTLPVFQRIEEGLETADILIIIRGTFSLRSVRWICSRSN